VNDSSKSSPVSAGQASLRNAQIVNMSGAHLISQAIYVLAKLRIPDHLKTGALVAEELAELTGTHAPTLYRLMRTLAGYGFLSEDSEGRFSLTALGAALQSDAPGHMRSWVLFIAGPTSWRAFGELLHSVKTGEEAVQKVHGKRYFDLITDMPEETRFFNEAMIATFGTEPQAVAAAYDFSQVRTLVDVGGGTGNLLTSLLLANPRLSGVLYDRPDVAVEARRQVNEKGLTSRCEVLEGSFFDAVPVGGDAYMLSHILHDWDDESCSRILKQCHEAMQGKGRLLVLEQLILPGNRRDAAKYNDLLMLVMHCGRERTQSEFADLFAEAGFRLTRVVTTESPSAIIEAEPV